MRQVRSRRNRSGDAICNLLLHNRLMYCRLGCFAQIWHRHCTPPLLLPLWHLALLSSALESERMGGHLPVLGRWHSLFCGGKHAAVLPLHPIENRQRLMSVPSMSPTEFPSKARGACQLRSLERCASDTAGVCVCLLCSSHFHSMHAPRLFL